MICSEIGLPAPVESWQGRVHSVFEHSINISAERGQTLLVIHSFPDIVMPGSFYVKGLDTGDVPAGMEVSGDEGSIRVGNLAIKIAGDCRRTETHLPEMEGGEFLLEPYKRLLREARSSRQLPPETAGLVYGRLDGELKNFFEALARRDDGGLEAAARRCVGLGFGLTPSGDDMLSGILSVLRCYGREDFEHASRAVLAAAPGTNDISRSYLVWACRGYATDAVMRTLQGLTKGGADLAVRRLLKLGHTSGADILEGIIRAAEWTGKKQIIE